MNSNSNENSKNGKANNGIIKSNLVKEKVNSNAVGNNGQKTDDKLKTNNTKDVDRSKKSSKMEIDKKGLGNESSSVKPGQISCKKISELSSNVNNIVKTSSNIVTHANKDIGAYTESTAKQFGKVRQVENGNDYQRNLLVSELLRDKKKYLDLSGINVFLILLFLKY